MAHELDVNRRGFLKLSGGTTALSLLTGAGVFGFVLTATGATQAVALKVLNKQEARLLLAVTRTLFPHDFLPDAYYLSAVAAIDTKASGDPHIVTMVREGLTRLGNDFAMLPEGVREDKLRAMEKSPFFGLIHGETLNGLYGNRDVWTMLGYEGSAVEKGGYLNRGFDDIDWLPQS